MKLIQRKLWFLALLLPPFGSFCTEADLEKVVNHPQAEYSDLQNSVIRAKQ